MTDRQKQLIMLAGLDEADFEPKDSSAQSSSNSDVESRVSELESALSALLRGDTE